MGKKTDFDKTQLFYYRKGKYNTKDFWKPGDDVTEKDKEMLKSILNFYCNNGYLPSKNEISNSQQIKSRFRTWDNALQAAGLPSSKDPYEVKKKQEIMAKKTE